MYLEWRVQQIEKIKYGSKSLWLSGQPHGIVLLFPKNSMCKKTLNCTKILGLGFSFDPIANILHLVLLIMYTFLSSF